MFERGYLAVNAGYQPAANDFTGTWHFEMYRETGTASSRYPVEPAMLFDAGVGVRVWRSLMAAVAVSRLERRLVARASADVPHPFTFFQMRHVEGDSAPVTRTETSIHVNAMWVFAPSRRLRVALAAGPTRITLSQPVVTSVTVAETYPYDTATFSGAAIEARSVSKVTFNAGTELSYTFAGPLGIGGVLRFSRADLPLKASDGTEMTARAGGLQVGLGLRLRF